MKNCKRCGKCCKGCKFLVYLPNKTTLCRIYYNKDRINKEVRKGVYCIPRDQQKESFDGCPLNPQ